jgi:hypothetical protein
MRQGLMDFWHLVVGTKPIKTIGRQLRWLEIMYRTRNDTSKRYEKWHKLQEVL